MDYVYIGKIVNTHALKGEVRIISDFEYKDRVFKINGNLYIGKFKDKEVIETYRVHKQFDMVKFKGIDYINDVLKYKGCNVYCLREELILNDDELLNSDYLEMTLYCDENEIGKISEFRNDNGNKFLRVNDRLIPYNKDFISMIDKSNKKIVMHDIEVFL